MGLEMNMDTIQYICIARKAINMVIINEDPLKVCRKYTYLGDEEGKVETTIRTKGKKKSKKIRN